MRHLDEGTIHAWLDGALSVEAERKAEQHAARCTVCAVAVADARGLIAATSRILSALDDVPAGVIPQPREFKAPKGAAIKPAPAPKRWPTWTARIAASIAVVVTGTLLVVNSRSGPNSLTSLGATRDERSRAAMRPAMPAEAPASASADKLSGNTVAPIVVQAQAEPKAKPADLEGRLDSASLAAREAQPARQLASNPDSTRKSGLAGAPAAAPMAPMAPAPAASAVAANRAVAPAADSARTSPQLTDQVASVPPKIAVKSASGGAGKGAEGLDRVAMPAGWRLVSEQQLTGTASVERLRVYEISPGVQVTYTVISPTAESDAKKELADSAPADSDVLAKDDANEENPGVNSIRWNDRTGIKFRLSGRLPLDSLRALRPLLPRHLP